MIPQNQPDLFLWLSLTFPDVTEKLETYFRKRGRSSYANELAQETLTRLMALLRQNAELWQYSGERRIKCLMTIARNVAVERYRKIDSHETALVEEYVSQTAHQEHNLPPEDSVIRQQCADLLKSALHAILLELDADDRTILQYRYFMPDGTLKYSEISTFLRLSPDTVRQRGFRAHGEFRDRVMASSQLPDILLCFRVMLDAL